MAYGASICQKHEAIYGINADVRKKFTLLKFGTGRPMILANIKLYYKHFPSIHCWKMARRPPPPSYSQIDLSFDHPLFLAIFSEFQSMPTGVYQVDYKIDWLAWVSKVHCFTLVRTCAHQMKPWFRRDYTFLHRRVNIRCSERDTEVPITNKFIVKTKKIRRNKFFKECHRFF